MTKYTETSVKRMVEGIGLVYRGLSGSNSISSAKVLAKCLVHGDIVISSVSNLMLGKSKCSKCSRDKVKAAAAERMVSKEGEYTKLFFATGKYPDGTVFSALWKGVWEVYCPVCSTATKAKTGDLRKGSRPCVCSVYAKSGRKNLHSRIIESLPEGTYFVSAGKRARDPVTLSCAEHGEYTLCSGSTVLAGHVSCPKCHRAGRRSSDREITEKLTATGKFPTGSKFRWKHPAGGGSETVVFQCPVCRKDPVLGKWFEFEAAYGNFLKGQMPCRCGKRHVWGEDELKAALESKASEIGLSVKDITGCRMSDKCTMVCSVHGEFSRNIRNSLHTGSGCPSCANLNHDVFYIHGVYDQDLLVGLKYGLTKRNAKTNRLYLQNKKSIFDIRPLMMFSFDSPQDARDLETRLKSSLPRQFTKEEVADGYTETCSTSHLDLIVSMALDAGGRKKEE